MSAETLPPTNMPQASNAPAGPIRRALLGAALVLIIAAALRLASPEYLSHDLSHRLSGVLLGLVVIANANNVPKALPRRLPTSLTPAEEQSERRFVGWCLVLGGLGYAAAWLLAPIDRANTIAGLLLAATLILSTGRVILGRTRPSR